MFTVRNQGEMLRALATKVDGLDERLRGGEVAVGRLAGRES